MMKINHILGLDISTAVTGYAVLNGLTGDLIVLDHIDTRKEKVFWKIADTICAKLTALTLQFNITHVYIEESLQRFRRGFSSAATIAILHKINGVTSYISYKAFGVEPMYIRALAARTACGVKVRRAVTKTEKKDTRFVKQQVFDQMMLQYADLHPLMWPLTRPSKVNPQGRMQDSCFDRMDAYVIAMAGFKGCKSYAI